MELFLAKNKFYLMGLFVLLLVFWIAYSYFLVSPNWAQKESSLTSAKATLQRIEALLKPVEGSLDYPKAMDALRSERAVLETALEELTRIEFARDLGAYDQKAAKGGDLNNYFDKMRKQVYTTADRTLGLDFQPGLEDLGFRGKITEDPVPLNLARLFAVERFMQVAKRTKVRSILMLSYPGENLLESEIVEAAPAPKPRTPSRSTTKKADEPEEVEEAKPARIYQIPLMVRIKAPERDFAQLLYELQLPSDEKQNRSYFCLRGVQVNVQDATSGTLDATLALGTLYSEPMFVDALKIPVRAKRSNLGSGASWGQGSGRMLGY